MARASEVVHGLQQELQKAYQYEQVQTAVNLAADLKHANSKLSVMAKSNRTLHTRVQEAGILQVETHARGVEAENATLREKLQCYERHLDEMQQQEEAAAQADKIAMAKVSVHLGPRLNCFVLDSLSI